MSGLPEGFDESIWGIIPGKTYPYLKGIDYIAVIYNDKLLISDQVAIMRNDRVVIPFRAICEAFGAEVSWNEKTQTVTAIKNGLELSLQMDNPQMVVNGSSVTLDITPEIINSRTLVSIRAISEGIGATINWDGVRQQVIITTD